MNVLLLHLDGRMQNLALMRISAHHKALGDTVELRRADNKGSLKRAHERVQHAGVKLDPRAEAKLVDGLRLGLERAKSQWAQRGGDL